MKCSSWVRPACGACALLVLGWSAPARGQQAEPAAAPPEAPAPPLDYSLVVAGGVSLGSYQAGLLYYLTAAIHADKQTPGASAFRVVTGASAGSANAALAAFAGCKRPERDPEQSIFYRTWIPVGITPKNHHDQDLYSEAAITARSVLSRAPLDERISDIGEYFADPRTWLARGCSVDLGLVATRLEPRVVPLLLGGDGALEIPRQSEKFVLRFSKPQGAKARLMQRRPPRGDGADALDLYPLLGSAEPTRDIALDSLAQVLKASASFPVAFEPVSLWYRQQRSDGTYAAARQDEFIDGGVFENLPVRLAVRLNRWRDAEPGAPRARHAYVVVDSDTEGWRRTAPVRKDKGSKDLFPTLLRFASGFVTSARSSELFAAVEDQAELRDPESRGDRLLLPRRRAPTASGHFVNFLGFFEKDFRIFDFYLGMLDARAFLAREQTAPEPAIESKTFECFKTWDRDSRGFEQQPPRLPDACSGSVEPNLVALLRASTDFKRWTQSEGYATSDEWELDHWFGLLGRHRFEFKDSEGEDADDVKGWVRDTLQDIAVEMAQRQDSYAEKLAVTWSVKAGSNFLFYREPRTIIGAGLNVDRGLEISVGYRPFRAGQALRFDLGARGVGITNRFTDKDDERAMGWTLAPFAHAVWLPSTSPVVQFELFGGYAHQFSLRGLGGYVADRSGFDAGLMVVALQRIYVRAGATYLLPPRLGQNYDASAASIVDTPILANIAVGARALW
jgi:hypothetical protein